MEDNKNIEPKFRVGQKIRFTGNYQMYPKTLKIAYVTDNQYMDINGLIVPFKLQDDWELLDMSNIWPSADEFKGDKYNQIPRWVIVNRNDQIFEVGPVLEVFEGHISILNEDGSNLMSLLENDKWAFLDELLATDSSTDDDEHYLTIDEASFLKVNPEENASKHKFEIGDRVNINGRPDEPMYILTITNIIEELKCYNCEQGSVIMFGDEDKWHLVEKFPEVPKTLEDEIDYLNKRYPEVSFAKLTRIAKHVSSWQQRKDIEAIPKWEKTPQTAFTTSSDMLYMNGYKISLQELFERLPKKD